MQTFSSSDGRQRANQQHNNQLNGPRRILREYQQEVSVSMEQSSAKHKVMRHMIFERDHVQRMSQEAQMVYFYLSFYTAFDVQLQHVKCFNSLFCCQMSLQVSSSILPYRFLWLETSMLPFMFFGRT